MYSEWLIHVPENMADEWVMVPCPEGKRVLVVAMRVVGIFAHVSGHSDLQ